MNATFREPTSGGFSALTPGTILERYAIERVIAAGGFGITYLCRHTKLGKPYALKEHFPRQFAYRDGATSEVRPSDPAVFSWALDRFLQEGRSLAQCHHPNVVTVADVFEGNGTAYIVLGYENGRSLKSWLGELGRPPSQEEVDGLLVPLLDALEYVHELGLLHRDIAPDNIMVRHDGSPCLIDFGAARRAVAERSQMMSAIIKSGYSPPEQYTRSGRAQGPWSDIYALGATLYRAVSGETPQEAPDRQVDDELRPVAEVIANANEYRPAFLDAIDQSLRLRYAGRPQSVAAWRAMLLARVSDAPQLKRIIEANSPPSANRVDPRSVDPSIEAARSSPLRSRVPLALAIAAALSISVSLGWGMLSYRPAQDTRKQLLQEPLKPDPLLALVPGSGKSARDRLADGSPCSFCPEMVGVPAGRFTMGSPASEAQRESREVQVSVTIARPSAVGKFAVTFDEWDACVADGGCNGHKPDDQGWGRGQRPVINVNWDDAQAYVKWLSSRTGRAYRLPSEAEREYVTRAGTTTPFWWGSSITPAQANYDGSAAPYPGGGSKGDYRQQTVPVDSFQPNEWGLFNVHGNVWEWTEDCWNDLTTGNAGDGSARTTGDCTRRVVRGGSWFSDPRILRAALRVPVSTVDRVIFQGFRLARTLTP